MGFQDPATPIAARIIEIHHHVFFFLIIVFCFVSYLIYKTVIRFAISIPEIFSSKKVKI
jgi:heme/copper-type cytochrome/quinol oxidase subunit 2